MLIHYLITTEGLPEYLAFPNTLAGSVLTIVFLVLWLAMTVTAYTSPYPDNDEKRRWNLIALLCLAVAAVSLIVGGVFTGVLILLGLFGLFFYVVILQAVSVIYPRPNNLKDDDEYGDYEDDEDDGVK